MVRPFALVMLMSIDLAPASAQAAAPDPDFLRLHAETRGFMLGRPNGATPTPDGRSVLFLRSTPRAPVNAIYEFDVATGKTRELLTPDALLRGAEENLSAAERAMRERMRVATRGFTRFELSKDGALLLVSLSGRLYTVPTKGGAATELPTGTAPLLDPRLSPDGKKVAYVRDRDLYILDLGSSRETRLTTSSDPGISNGLAEFVAQEEMDRFAGYWWSPDGSTLAFEEADNRAVEILHIVDAAHPEKEVDATPYPRPGKHNATVRLGLVKATGGPVTWIGWDAVKLPYLASVSWRGAGPLTLVVMSREQQDISVLSVDAATGRSTELWSEHDAAWLNLDQSVPRWLPDGSAILWSSDRDGTNRLELRDPHGKRLRALSPDGVEYIKLLHVDARARTAWFLGTAEQTEQHLYRVSLDEGGKAERITQEPGVHNAVFADTDGAAPTYALTSVTLEAMPRTTIHAGSQSGHAAGELPSVAIDPPFIAKVEVARAGEAKLRAIVVRPRAFDPKKRYPVWVDVYGGPHHLQTVRAAPLQLLRQWIADHGYIVIAIDGHGTPHRGRDFERAIRGDFGKVPLDDQISALQALAKERHEIDLSRVGIVGWSFGGYMSALAVLRRSDFFHVAVAGAPVVDWRDYDTTYTERYLGLPDKNEAGYRQSSLLTHAPGLLRPLLLLHGTSDDNVYFFHSLKLADALLRAGKSFDLVPLAGFTHMVPDPVVRTQMWSRILSTMASALKP